MSNLRLQKSEHQRMVEEFMLRAGQDVPFTAEMPSRGVRYLRARLILEEALETIEALGVKLQSTVPVGWGLDMKTVGFHARGDALYEKTGRIADVIDGCCDLAVVTTGTLSAFGIPDIPFQNEVNLNNLAKFAPGHEIREDGKLIKPPSHEPPRIQKLLDRI